MYFTQNSYRMNSVLEETTRRTYLTQLSDRSIKQQGCHRSLRLHPLSPIFLRLTTTLMSQRYHMLLGGSSRSSPPSLSDLNLPPNPFNILATMAVVHQTQNTHDDNYSPQSPEPSELSSISTPTINVSAFNNWETSYTSTDDNTFYDTSDEPRRVYWDLSSDDDLGSSVPRNPSVASSPCVTPPPPRAQKRKISLGMSFPKDGGVSQHICEACGHTIPTVKDTPGPSSRN